MVKALSRSELHIQYIVTIIVVNVFKGRRRQRRSAKQGEIDILSTSKPLG